MLLRTTTTKIASVFCLALIFLLVNVPGVDAGQIDNLNSERPQLEAAAKKAGAEGASPERKDIHAKYKWNLTDIYPSNEAWNKDFTKVEGQFKKISGYQGKLASSAGTFKEFMELRNDVLMIFDKLLAYAHMWKHEDTRNDKAQALVDRVNKLETRVKSAFAWVEPEILQIGWKKLETWMKDDKQMASYRHYLGNIYRQQMHTLPSEQEKLLAMSGDMAQGPVSVFSMFANADLKYPYIKGPDGKQVELTQGRYYKYMKSENRRLRRDAFKGFYDAWIKYKNTLAANYSAQVNRDVFYSRARNYKTSLEATLDADNISVEVYKNLIKTVKAKGVKHLRRYIKLKGKAMGLKEMHLYDITAPIIKGVSKEVSYEKAKQMVIDAIAPMGEQYVKDITKAFNSGWIDVYENRGKRGGAYSWGTYSVHPYVLLNYNDTLNNAFTVAHEMGHLMHSFYTYKNQPFLYGEYSLFVAEVASTFNEALLTHHLLGKKQSKNMKKYLLAQWIEDINGTFFIQTMFADFELRAHQMAEKGQPLTADSLAKLYNKILTEYYGDAITIDSEYDYTWMRIPHFYRNHYVYKYATSYAASMALSQKVRKGEKGALKNYLAFLSAGSSVYPIDVLKMAGVDMSKPEPIESCIDLYGELVEELDKLMK